VDEQAPPTNVAPLAKPTAGSNRAAQIFAVIGLVIAAVATGLYLFSRADAPPRLSPEDAVREFLSGVFLAADPHRVGGVVCSNWDPAEAITRTAGEVAPDAHVSWDQFVIVTVTDQRASATARLGVRRPDDRQPSSYRQWRFSLVNENGWRVCEARPAT
jgi:hypothetical protein